MKRSTPRGKDKFKDSWMQTYTWAKKKSATHVTCTLCNADINYVNMGESALKRHEKPNKIVWWLKGEVCDIFWEVMPLCFSGSKFTQVYENKR